MIDLSELRRLVVQEFREAERRARESVSRTLRQAREEEVTALFATEVERELEKASNSGAIAFAVRTDLERAYQMQRGSAPKRLAQVTNGLIARVSRHGLAEERKTGGDFGLLVVEPLFRLRWGPYLEVERVGRKRGILVQAKRCLHGGRWNQLTDKQEQRLPERMAYAALLRYEFADVDNRQLNEFRWTLLAQREISEAIEWLRSGNFPGSVDTADLVAGLSRGSYGTDDPQIIERNICVDAGPSVVVEVDWEEGTDPGPSIRSLNRDVTWRQTQPEKVRIHLGLS